MLSAGIQDEITACGIWSSFNGMGVEIARKAKKSPT